MRSNDMLEEEERRWELVVSCHCLVQPYRSSSRLPTVPGTWPHQSAAKRRAHSVILTVRVGGAAELVFDPDLTEDLYNTGYDASNRNGWLGAGWINGSPQLELNSEFSCQTVPTNNTILDRPTFHAL